MGWANQVMEQPRNCRRRAVREVVRRAENQESRRETAAMNTAPPFHLAIGGLAVAHVCLICPCMVSTVYILRTYNHITLPLLSVLL